MTHPIVHPEPAAQLGERIGIGRTAEVFARGDGQIVKVIRPGFPDRLGEREADVARLVTSLGLEAPRFVAVERIDGRIALVYERVSGPSMLDQLTRHPWKVDALARAFGGLHAGMHGASGTGLADLKAEVRKRIEWAADEVGGFPVEPVFGRLDDLADGAAVCHGDMHPGNVILAPSGPTVIDWMTAACGPPEADLARTEFLLIGSDVPDSYPRLQSFLIGRIRRRFASGYLEAYRQLRPIDDEQLRLWRLPVLVARLSERIAEEREGLLARIRAELAETARLGQPARIADSNSGK